MKRQLITHQGKGEFHTYPCETCFICGGNGGILYHSMPDLWYTAPGKWDVMYCSQCKLGWINPQPMLDDIGKLYVGYQTHSVREKRGFPLLNGQVGGYILSRHYGYDELKQTKVSLFVRMMSCLPWVKEAIGMRILHLDASQRGKLLDVGCGNGRFLADMKRLGWDVEGVDVDENAVAVAREYFGLDAIVGELEDIHFPDESFDAITLNHVIEHVPDPIGLLVECKRTLKKDGKIVLATPNIESLGRKLFKEYWRGWEVPRHINTFSLDSIKLCVQRAGFSISFIDTSARKAQDIYRPSRIAKMKKKSAEVSLIIRAVVRMERFLFHILEEIIIIFSKKFGEELYVIASKDK